MLVCLLLAVTVIQRTSHSCCEKIIEAPMQKWKDRGVGRDNCTFFFFITSFVP